LQGANEEMGAATGLRVRGRFPRSLWSLLIGSLILTLVPTVGDAAPGKVKLEIIVAHLSNEPGKIDPRAARIHKELENQFRYSSISALSAEHFELSLDDVGRHELPTGRTIMLKPIVIDEASALISVDITGLVQTVLRLENDQLVIIGAESHQGGKLVIAILLHL
jgi:hypothetical protein